MKNSHIFWNVVIVILMIILPMLFFEMGSWIEMIAAILGVNSLFLILSIDSKFKDDEVFQPSFLFFSWLGFLLIGIGLIVYFFMWLYKLFFINNTIKFISNMFNNFNNWLDGKK